jgi:Ca2+-transporting ATPase
MEQAFHRLAGEQLADTEHLHPQWTLAREYELSPALLAMSHLWQAGGNAQQVVSTKGAPEAVADLCHLPAGQRAGDSPGSTPGRPRLRVLGVAKARHPPAQGWPAGAA